MAGTLPGSDLTQAQVDAIVKAGPAPGQTWFGLLATIRPLGLNETPLWWSTVLHNAQTAGHITSDQALLLSDPVPVGSATDEPTSLLKAWDDLMAAMGKTWPKRRQRATAQLQRMNIAVTQAQRKLARG